MDRTAAPYRPQLRWILLGPLVGVVSGIVVAFALLMGGSLVDGPSPTAGDLLGGIGALLILAVIFGGLCGAAVGLVTGVLFSLLVGRHLARPVARRRARVLGVLLPPIVMHALLSLLSGQSPFVGWSSWDLVTDWLFLFAGASVLGGTLAARAEARMLPHDEVS